MTNLQNSSTILRANIIGDVPPGADYAHFNPTRAFIQKFYRINEFDIPQYWGEQGGWHASFSFTKETLLSCDAIVKIE